jgi:hypothetical protein
LEKTTVTKAAQLDAILKSDPFYSSDTNLDLSAFPHLQESLAAPEPEEKFAPLDTRGMGLGSSDLKALLRNPDREAIKELRDPELLRRFDEEHGDGRTVYAGGVPFQIAHRDGRWRAKGETPNGTVHRFTAATRDDLFPKINRAVSENTVRELSPGERLECVRLAQSGQIREAIARYLEFAIGRARASRYDDANALLGDPALTEVFDDACMLTWFAARPNVQDSDDWGAFLQNYAGGRPLTHDLLDGAWHSFEHQHTSHLLDTRLLDAREPTVTDLNDLDDETINKTFWSTLKHAARSGR